MEQEQYDLDNLMNNMGINTMVNQSQKYNLQSNHDDVDIYQQRSYHISLEKDRLNNQQQIRENVIQFLWFTCDYYQPFVIESIGNELYKGKYITLKQDQMGMYHILEEQKVQESFTLQRLMQYIQECITPGQLIYTKHQGLQSVINDSVILDNRGGIPRLKSSTQDPISFEQLVYASANLVDYIELSII